ncbi:MAG: aspartyl protease family protein [Thermoproteota archaeon]|jgi:clan AA aspartic protease|nr:aspartyl protease family protein [Thermoproteota archaeon]
MNSLFYGNWIIVFKYPSYYFRIGELMGHVWADVKLINVVTGQEIKVTALIDTGATFTVLPWWIHEKLGLKIIGRKKIETAKGYTELDESFVLIELEGRSGITPVLISKELKDVLVGVLTLESLGLMVDPTSGKLKETRILLL